MKELDYQSIIKNIVNYSQEKLNDWEIDFISSVYDWHVLKSGKLSEKQKENIVKINRKYIAVR